MGSGHWKLELSQILKSPSSAFRAAGFAGFEESSATLALQEGIGTQHLQSASHPEGVAALANSEKPESLVSQKQNQPTNRPAQKVLRLISTSSCLVPSLCGPGSRSAGGGHTSQAKAMVRFELAGSSRSRLLGVHNPSKVRAAKSKSGRSTATQRSKRSGSVPF